MQNREVNECRTLLINYAIEIAFKKKWPYVLENMMKDANIRLQQLVKSGYCRLEESDKVALLALVEKDFKSWIETVDPTPKR